MDFTTNAHRVYSVTAYFDFELNTYQVQAIVATTTAAELSTINAIIDVKQQLDPYIFQDGEEPEEPDPQPEAFRSLNYPSAFNYWLNPGVATTELNQLAFDELRVSTRELVNDQIMKKVVVPAGSKIRFRLQDGTFVVLKTVELQTGYTTGSSTLEFTVVELQAPDGTIIPLVRSDITDDWALIQVPSAAVMNLIIDRLSLAGVAVYRQGGAASEDEVYQMECVENSPGDYECNVAPVPKAE